MKNRRVGTFTLGLSLIAFGIIFLIALFSKSFDYMAIIKFSPVILILLGIEIILGAILTKDDKMKYDGLSIFMCICVIFVSMLLSGAALAYKKFGNEFITQERYRQQLHNTISDELSEYPFVTYESASLDIYDTEGLPKAYNYDDSKMHVTLYINISLDNDTKEEFADKIVIINNKLKNENIGFNLVKYTADNNLHFDSNSSAALNNDRELILNNIVEY